MGLFARTPPSRPDPPASELPVSPAGQRRGAHTIVAILLALCGLSWGTFWMCHPYVFR